MPSLSEGLSYLVAATNPASLSVRGWVCLAACIAITYLRSITTASRKGPLYPNHGFVFSILYGFFSTRACDAILRRLLHTRRGEPQEEQAGGTTPVTRGGPSLRIKVLPILGQAFGGNYAYLVWDEADEKRRCIAIDPADPYPVLRAAQTEGLEIDVVLTTHWHFDHSGGNETLARELPGVRVVGSTEERARVPAMTTRMADLETLTLGNINVMVHVVPGHTLGSAVYEITSSAAPEQPSAIFTGDTLFCGGCGALFEGSAGALFASLRRLRERLSTEAEVYSGHEYAEMLMRMAVARDPRNEAAREQQQRTRLLRQQKLPTVPSKFGDELRYNPYLLASSEQELALLCGCEV